VTAVLDAPARTLITGASCPLHRDPLDACAMCRTASDITGRLDHERWRCRPWQCPWHHSDPAFLAACAHHGIPGYMARRWLAEVKEAAGRG
jgi:hypothetical protein